MPLPTTLECPDCHGSGLDYCDRPRHEDDDVLGCQNRYCRDGALWCATCEEVPATESRDRLPFCVSCAREYDAAHGLLRGLFVTPPVVYEDVRDPITGGVFHHSIAHQHAVNRCLTHRGGAVGAGQIGRAI
jgi:hypothetical protein